MFPYLIFCNKIIKYKMAEIIYPYEIPFVFDVTDYSKSNVLKENVVFLWYPIDYKNAPDLTKKITLRRNTENIRNYYINSDLDKVKDFNKIRKENLKCLVENFNIYIAVFKFDEEKKIFKVVSDYYDKTKDYSVYIKAFYNINKLFHELDIKANVYNLTNYYSDKYERDIDYLHSNLKNEKNKEILKNSNNSICTILGENKDLKIFGENIIIKDNDIKETEKKAISTENIIKQIYFNTRRPNIKNIIKDDLLRSGATMDDDIEKMINYIFKALGLNL